MFWLFIFLFCCSVIDQASWKSAVNVFENLMMLEIQNDSQLHALLLLARSQGDTATGICRTTWDISIILVAFYKVVMSIRAEVFLAGMVSAQTDAVGELDTIVRKVKAYSAMPGLLYHLDHELGKQKSNM